MPGIVTHLVIADKVYEELPKGLIKNKADFLAGSIAPDAVHARSDYKREHKKLSHLRQCIADADFHKEKFHSVFKTRLWDFASNRIMEDNRQLDIDLGYLVHLISDEIFLLTVQRELSIELEKVSILQSSKEYIPYITSIKNNTDLRLVSEYYNLDSIRDLLHRVEPFEIESYLSEQHLSISRKWVIRTYLEQKHEYVEPKIIPSKRMDEFIVDATKATVDYIKGTQMFCV